MRFNDPENSAGGGSEPLAGTTKPERSKERSQTKRQSTFVAVQELVIFERTLLLFFVFNVSLCACK